MADVLRIEVRKLEGGGMVSQQWRHVRLAETETWNEVIKVAIDGIQCVKECKKENNEQLSCCVVTC